MTTTTKTVKQRDRLRPPRRQDRTAVRAMLRDPSADVTGGRVSIRYREGR